MLILLQIDSIRTEQIVCQQIKHIIYQNTQRRCKFDFYLKEHQFQLDNLPDVNCVLQFLEKDQKHSPEMYQFGYEKRKMHIE